MRIYGKTVVVINPFEVPKAKEEQALAMGDQLAEYFRRQPWYVSSKLHRVINPDARFHLVTVAEWASTERFMAALNNLELHNILETAKDHSPNYRGLYEVIRS